MGGRNRGGQKRGRTQRRHFRDGRQDAWKKPRPDGEEQPPREGGWDPFVTESPAFELYYKRQHIVPEEEWDSFLATLRRPLPAVFRVNSSGQFATEIRTQIQEEFAGALNCEVDGEQEEVVKPLPWYPGKFAWHLNFSRMQLRKNQMLARLHAFLKRENEIGNITRQEAVSMVPPLFLDVQPNHRVLDMCAAPGSKTFQLLEMIHRDDKKGSLSNGLVVANDVDVQRCHLLVHQTKRMCSPNVIVTNHEAQHFPGLRKDREIAPCATGENASTLSADAKITELNEERGLVFDCILCDVPCSGDGTIRKAPDIWKKWNLGNANGLHRLQIQIAMRGVALLRVGGRIVYSTCSLNPIENEAVVGEILRRSEGCLELLDVSNELPELKRRPGLKTWKVRDKGLWISSYRNVNKHRAGSIVPSMFPSGSPEDLYNAGDEELLAKDTPAEETPLEILEMSEENVQENPEIGDGEIATLPLEWCLRILPHDQDTGGFFVAVFRKIAPLKDGQHLRQSVRKQTSSRKEELHSTVHADVGELGTNQEHLEAEAVVQQSSETANQTTHGGAQCNDEENMVCGPEAQPKAKPSRPQQQGNWKGVDPVLFLTDEVLIESIISFYGIKETLPLRGHLVTRSEDTTRLKRIYYISESVAKVLRLNFRTGEQMKITSLGLKIFERQGGKESFSPCAFRIASEGLPLLLPHLTRQLVRASKEDFKKLLSVKTTPFSAFSDSGFVASLQAFTPGCCVVILDDSGQDYDQSQNSSVTAIGCWRGRSNLSLLIPKEEALQLLERLFNDGEKDLEPLKIESEAPASIEDVAEEDAQDGTNMEPLLASMDGGDQEEADASLPPPSSTPMDGDDQEDADASLPPPSSISMDSGGDQEEADASTSVAQVVFSEDLTNKKQA